MDKIYSTLCNCWKGSEQMQPPVSRELEAHPDSTGDSVGDTKLLRTASVTEECSANFNALVEIQNQQILCGDSNGRMFSVDYMKDEVLKKWDGHSKSITKACVEADVDGPPSNMFTASRDLSIKMWKISGGFSCTQEFKGHHDLVVTAVAAHPKNRNVICSGSRDNTVALWDVSTGSVTNSVKIARNLVTDLCWKDDILAQTSEDKSLRLWDPRSLEVTHTFIKKQQILTSCDVSGSIVATSSSGFNGSGCEISLWDHRNTTLPYHEFKGHTEKVNKCSFVADSQSSSVYLVSVSADRSLRVWNVKDFTEEYSVCLSNQIVTFTQLSPASSTSCSRFAVSLHDIGVGVVSAPQLSHPD